MATQNDDIADIVCRHTGWVRDAVLRGWPGMARNSETVDSQRVEKRVVIAMERQNAESGTHR